MKPTLMKVQLKPEEAILGACKKAASVGPATSGCTSGVACNVISS
jgi:hypothetical protein